MSPLHLRPEGLRLPWQALAAFALIVYAVRAALRGWDFVPDVLDLLVFGALAAILLARPLVARLLSDDEPDRDEADADEEDSR